MLKEVRQRIRSTDVTDVTDIRKKEEGRRKINSKLPIPHSPFPIPHSPLPKYIYD
ncbi:hypothetical protein QT971_13815 [Microcoleus sp. herbarium19]|uniref:hypothetical protein n=1 Tax=unclassified Microcoleus TaxID=2642155 RepID=UPI002FD0B421